MIEDTSPGTTEATMRMKFDFDAMISTDDCSGLYAMVQEIEPSQFIDLYNSFEKGTIGKYKQLVDAMITRGREQLSAVFEDTIFHPENIPGMIEDLTEPEMAVILKWSPPQFETEIMHEIQLHEKRTDTSREVD